MDKSLKVARIATVPFFLDNQLRQQINDLILDGYDVSAIASEGHGWERLEKVERLKCIKLNIERAPALFKDLKTLGKLIKLFYAEQYDVIHSTTPKAGLLCAIAAWVVRTPIRMHTFTGQTWATKTGLSRQVLRFFDRIIVCLNTQCYADSISQCNFLIKEGVGNKNKIKVLGLGSLAGVDLNRFDVKTWLPQRDNVLRELGYNKSDFIITFIGRISGDKGIYELMRAFSNIKEKGLYPNVKLMLVGPCEEQEIQEVIPEWNNIEGFKSIGITRCPEKYLSISKLLCLPSYREGFGTVVIEAAAMQVPTVGTKIVGLEDAIVDGETGLTVEVKNVEALEKALITLIQNEQKLKTMSRKAYQRCCEYFDVKQLSKAVSEEYQSYYEQAKNK